MKNFVLVEYDPNISVGGVHDYGKQLAVSKSKDALETYCKDVLKQTLFENTNSINNWQPYCVIEETNLVIV